MPAGLPRARMRRIASSLTSSPPWRTGIFGRRDPSSGSHFTGLLMQTLHAQRRCVPPPHDVLCRVAVGVVAVPALNAREARLALTTSRVHGTAGRTGLRRVGRIDLDDPAATLLHFVGEDQLKRAPALRQDGAVETSLLPDQTPRIGKGARRRGGHGPDAQVLQHHDAEPPGDLERSAVVEVTSDASRTGLETRNPLPLPSIAARASLAPGKRALRPALGGLNPIQARRHGQHLARGQGEGVGHAPVDPDDGAEILRSVVLNLAGEGDVPSVRPARDGHILDIALDRAGIAELHPTDLRQAHGAPFPVQAAGFDLPAGEAEGVVDTFLARRRIAYPAAEEVGEGFVEVAQRLLLAGDVDGLDPVVLCSEARQFSGLLNIAETVRPAPRRPLLQGEIVDEAAYARELAEQGFLLSGRTQLEAEAAGDHPETLQIGLRSRNMDVRRGRHAVYALHAP